MILCSWKILWYVNIFFLNVTINMKILVQGSRWETEDAVVRGTIYKKLLSCVKISKRVTMLRIMCFGTAIIPLRKPTELLYMSYWTNSLKECDILLQEIIKSAKSWRWVLPRNEYIVISLIYSEMWRWICLKYLMMHTMCNMDKSLSLCVCVCVCFHASSTKAPWTDGKCVSILGSKPLNEDH